MTAITASSRGGLAVAQWVAPFYLGHPSVRLVILGGSVARGCADRYSDLEIGVFWTEPPVDEERKRTIRRIGGEAWNFEPYTSGPDPGGFEHIGLTGAVIEAKRYTGCVMLSVQHLTVGDAEQCLSDVLCRYDTSPRKQGFAYEVQHAVPLLEAPLLRQWQARLAAYPEELGRRMVQENLWLGPWFYPEQLAFRDDRLVLYRHFCLVAQGILKVLMGLNRIYQPSAEFKWMDELVGSMRLAPSNLSSRLNQIFQADPLEGGRQLIGLAGETLTLIERHMPEIVTSSERKRWEPWYPYTLLEEIGAHRNQ